MKVYVAGYRIFSHSEIEHTMKAVVEAGHELAWNWLTVMDQDEDDSDASRWFADQEYAAAMRYLGVMQSDVLILIDSAYGKEMYTEVGVALVSTNCKKIIVVNPESPHVRPNTFFFLPKVTCVNTVDKALEVLEDIRFIEESP